MRVERKWGSSKKLDNIIEDTECREEQKLERLGAFGTGGDRGTAAAVSDHD